MFCNLIFIVDDIYEKNLYYVVYFMKTYLYTLFKTVRNRKTNI